MKAILFIIPFVLFLTSCKQKDQILKNGSTEITPNELLQKAIITHGGEELFKSLLIDFKIEKTFFSHQYDTNGRADFKQIRRANSKKHEVSYNSGHIEYRINDAIQPEESYSKKMAETSLFGFLYTFSIPFNLTTNDVIVSKLSNVTIRGKEYHTLDVQFTKVPDLPEDRFLLYLNIDTYQIEYVALDHDISGSKPQFRRMINARRIKDILFQDYILFHANDTSIPLEKLYTKYIQSDLKVIRTIKFDSINVQNRL